MSKKISVPTKEELQSVYVEKLTISAVARHYNTSNPTVRKWMLSYDLAITNQHQKMECPDINKLKSLVASGTSYGNIRKETGWSLSKINEWVKDYGIVSPNLHLAQKATLPQKEELKELYQTKSLVELGTHYGVSNVTVGKWLDELGIPKRSRSEDQKMAANILNAPENVVEKYTQLGTVDQTAKHFGVSYPTVRKWLNEYNYEPSGSFVKLDEDQLVLLHDSMTQSELADHFDVSRKKIASDLDRLGVSRSASDAAKIAVENGKASKIEKYGYEYFQPGIRQSKGELEVQSFLNDELGFDFHPTRSILHSNREIDLYDEYKNVGIEFCGLYWHSEARQSDTNYHYKKYSECEDKGIDLITVFDLEWYENKDAIKKFLRSRLGVFGNRVYARDTRFIELKDKPIQFLKDNHIQGYPRNIEISFALEYDGNMLGVVTFGKHHRNLDVMTLNRLAFSSDIQVIGGASKLIKNSLKILNQPIVTWSDNRWSTGKIYETTGFTLDKNLNVDYFYTNGTKIKSKQSMKKSATGCPEHITEKEWNSQNGWWRVWDCGKKRWKFAVE